jgi:hypothetical protein
MHDGAYQDARNLSSLKLIYGMIKFVIIQQGPLLNVGCVYKKLFNPSWNLPERREDYCGF